MLEILRLFPFFNELSDTFRLKLTQNAELAHLPAGAVYFEEGHSCGQIALVGDGDIRVFKRGETGREITLYHVEKGQTCILSASCVLAQSTYPATAIVDREATAIVFQAGLFRDWIAQSEVIRQFIFSSLANRMAEVLFLIEELTFRKLDERLFEFLREKLKKSGQTQQLKMTHEEIAVELGSAREVISRLLKDFERKGIIVQNRGLIQAGDITLFT